MGFNFFSVTTSSPISSLAFLSLIFNFVFSYISSHTISSTTGIYGSIVHLPPRVVNTMKYPSFFEFYIMFLGIIPFWRWFNCVDIWQNCYSNYLIAITWDSTFWLIPDISAFISFKVLSYASSFLRNLPNISSILELPPLRVTVLWLHIWSIMIPICACPVTISILALFLS